MEEEVSDVDVYVDWLMWLSNVEKINHDVFKSRDRKEIVVLLQVHETEKDLVKDILIKSLVLQDIIVIGTRWEEICQNIQVDLELEMEKTQQLWHLLKCFQYVFSWNKGELRCCTIGEHAIDTQGFPPYKVSLSILSFWEDAKVKRQIDVLVDFGKMRLSNS